MSQLLILLFLSFECHQNIEGQKEEDLELPFLDLSTIANATNNFAINKKLGEGGFGPVYKGILEDGQEIAVKRLSRSSKQGLNEFKNEIISGKRSRGFYHPDHTNNLIGSAWILWNEGRPLELIDECLGKSCPLSEVLCRIYLSLLCVQQRPEDRPSMSSVVVVLGSESALPQPKKPGFFLEKKSNEAQGFSKLVNDIITLTCPCLLSFVLHDKAMKALFLYCIEAMAARVALQLAWDSGLRNVEVEGDSLVVIRALKDKERTGNNAAHVLARKVLDLHSEFLVWLEDVPDFLDHGVNGQVNNWLNGHATFYGANQNPTSLGGACGYDNTFHAGFGVNTAAVSGTLFRGGVACGACYQVMCNYRLDPKWCLWSRTMTITATNFCPPNNNGGWCDPPHNHFDMSMPAFFRIARQGNEGIVPVLYRR
uniref:Expansin-like EG45 domain-containing protein n=1 Tax=Fagus sylvatica TaxID=28930 RepID=A0A2N9G6L0_FAGSY